MADKKIELISKGMRSAKPDTRISLGQFYIKPDSQKNPENAMKAVLLIIMYEDDIAVIYEILS